MVAQSQGGNGQAAHQIGGEAKRGCGGQRVDGDMDLRSVSDDQGRRPGGWDATAREGGVSLPPIAPSSDPRSPYPPPPRS